MKTIFALLIFLGSTTYALCQNKAAYLNSLGQYYRCGDVSVTGNQLTVEALVKMDGTGYYMTGMSAFDIVSKHRGASDINYLLRPDHCELTTTAGYYYTTLTPSSFIKDSFYHMAMVYNGSSLRFYVNGCLFSETPATGNVVTNSYITTIGQLASDPGLIYNEQFFGYIDEVRIWQRARTDLELRENMQDLPSPSTQTGLLAYYKFEGNSVNVQGNAAFNAVPNGGATILSQPGFTKAKPLHASFFIQSTCLSPKGSIVAVGEGGISPVKYSLNGGPYQSSGQFTDLLPGNYVVSVKGSGSGCVFDTSINITNAYVDLGPDKNICIGDSVLLDAGNSGASYVWQDGSTEKFFKARDSGLYSVQVISGMCKSDDFIHIGFETAPSILNLSDTSICRGSSLIFNHTADPSLTYQWTPATFLSDASLP
ncbi:MAG TPA: LamG domain-containing protein, partial [Flavisolibacter sp.]|nr:LamG domain-containing protein [Flavisolibacter sp.]